MNKIIIFTFLSLIAFTGISQDKKIVFTKYNEIFVVKLSCKFESDEQRNRLKKTLLSNKNISSFKFSISNDNEMKITCTSPKDVEPFLLETLLGVGINNFENKKQ